MTQTETLHYSVEQLVNSDIPLLEELYQLLDQERKAIEALEFETVNRLVEQKMPLINQLSAFEQQRAELAQMGNARNWVTLVKQVQAVSPSVQFNRYHDLRRAVARQNQTNQMLAASTQQRVATLYALLNGQSNTPLTYDQQGRTQPEPAAQSSRL